MIQEQQQQQNTEWLKNRIEVEKNQRFFSAKERPGSGTVEKDIFHHDWVQNLREYTEKGILKSLLVNDLTADP